MITTTAFLWPWVGAICLLLGIVVCWLGWRRTRGPGRDGMAIAHSARLQALPRFARLVTIRRWSLIGQVVGLVLLLAGAGLLGMRSQTTTVDPQMESNRDIMLCLDVSASMDADNIAVISAVRDVVEQMQGERIGLTIFNSVAIRKFPLTDDYEFVTSELDRALAAFESYDFNYLAGTTTEVRASSLISDGMVSCVQGFDRPEEHRGRALLLATDNEPQGRGVYTLPEASQYARERGVVVYGLGASAMSLASRSRQRAEFEQAVTATGGTFTILGSDESAIVNGINSLERQRIESAPNVYVDDNPGWGRTLVLIGGLWWLLLVLGGLLNRTISRRDWGGGTA